MYSRCPVTAGHRERERAGWNRERRTPSTRNTPRPTDWLAALSEILNPCSGSDSTPLHSSPATPPASQGPVDVCACVCWLLCYVRHAPPRALSCHVLSGIYSHTSYYLPYHFSGSIGDTFYYYTGYRVSESEHVYSVLNSLTSYSDGKTRKVTGLGQVCSVRK